MTSVEPLESVNIVPFVDLDIQPPCVVKFGWSEEDFRPCANPAEWLTSYRLDCGCTKSARTFCERCKELLLNADNWRCGPEHPELQSRPKVLFLHRL